MRERSVAPLKSEVRQLLKISSYSLSTVVSPSSVFLVIHCVYIIWHTVSLQSCHRRVCSCHYTMFISIKLRFLYSGVIIKCAPITTLCSHHLNYGFKYPCKSCLIKFETLFSCNYFIRFKAKKSSCKNTLLTRTSK